MDKKSVLKWIRECNANVLSMLDIWLIIHTLAAVKALDLMANEAERDKNMSILFVETKKERKKDNSFLKKFAFIIAGKKRGKETNGCTIIQLHPDLEQVFVFLFFQIYKSLSYKILSTMPMPSCSNNSMIGSLISLDMGARTPVAVNLPSKTSWVAIPQGTPTVLAMAE